jgi:hypothetical protein
VLAPTKSPARRLLVTAAAAALLLIGIALLFMELLAKYESQQCTVGAPGPVAGVPANLVPIYESAAARYGLGAEGPAMLAAVNYIETSFGRNLSTSSTGAEGWMQFEPGTWAQYGVSADPSKPGAPPNPYDPWDAIFSAANLLHSLGAPGNWWQAIYLYGGRNPAEADEATQLAARYYQQGLNRSGGSQPVFVSTGCGAAPGQYANPFAAAPHIVADRIDMGVDYTDVQPEPIGALGAGVVTYSQATDPGWGPFSCSEGHSGAVVYRLSDGPDAGRYVYVTEGLIPDVNAGQRVSAAQPIGTFAGCIEIGWASGPSPSPQAAADGQANGSGDPGENRTFCGQQMSDLIQSLGGPAGLTEGKPVVGSSC